MHLRLWNGTEIGMQSERTKANLIHVLTIL